MSATGLNMGWTGVTITPSGGTAIAVDNVTNVTPGRKANPKKFYGDANAFPTLIVARERARTLSLTSGDVAKLAAIPDGTPCTVVAILNDPLNGAAVGGGALQYTLVNAICVSNGAKGDANEFGLATAEFDAFAPTGVDPLTIVAL